MTIETLADFLLARYAEDEQNIRENAADGEYYPNPESVERLLLTECEAKRRVVGIAAAGLSQPGRVGKTKSGKVATPLERWNDLALILAALALPYREHPDFREEWRA